MLFNSLQFLFLFLPITYFIFWKLGSKNQRYVWLTITGYVFYGTWNYKFCAFMAFSTVVSSLSGLAMMEYDGGRRKLYLVLPIIVDLLLLGYFKYLNFGLRVLGSAASWFHWTMHIEFIDVVMPV